MSTLSTWTIWTVAMLIWTYLLLVVVDWGGVELYAFMAGAIALSIGARALEAGESV